MVYFSGIVLHPIIRMPTLHPSRITMYTEFEREIHLMTCQRAKAIACIRELNALAIMFKKVIIKKLFRRLYGLS
jgi:hypothetical protein